MTDPKTTNLRDIKIHEPSPLLVEAMKKMLEDAESGLLQGMVGVCIFEAGNVDQFWYDPPKWYHTSVLADRIVGALERCKYKLMRIHVWAEEDREDEDDNAG